MQICLTQSDKRLRISHISTYVVVPLRPPGVLKATSICIRPRDVNKIEGVGGIVDPTLHNINNVLVDYRGN